MTVAERFKKLKEKYSYNGDLAEGKIRFVENNCTHVEGDLAGKPLILEEWQKEEIFRPIFGFVRKDGKRLINRVYIQMPRKNGKTTMCAPIELILLMTDAEGGAKIYNCAGDDKQAKLLFDITKQMVTNSEKLSNLCKKFQSRILFKDRYIEKITSKSDTKHGFNSHGFIYDEIHVAPNRQLYDTLKTSTGQRSQPLGIAITTPGTDKESICHELYSTSKSILEGKIENDNFWCVIYESEKEDDPFSEETWRKANPLYDTSPYLRMYIKQAAKEAENNPSEENTFRRLHLGQWTQAETRWMNTEVIEACYNPELIEEDYYGEQCYLGLDFASTQDMVGYSNLILTEIHSGGQRNQEKRVYKWFCKLWIPEKAAIKYEKKFNIPYSQWEKEGWINIVPGNIVSFEEDVEPAINENIQNFAVRSMGYDQSYGATQMALRLQNNLGLEVNKVLQGFKMHPGIDKMSELFKDKRVEFNNPVLKWQFDNVLILIGNYDAKTRLIKPQDEKKIDGIVSGVMAVYESMMRDPEEEATDIMVW